MVKRTLVLVCLFLQVSVAFLHTRERTRKLALSLVECENVALENNLSIHGAELGLKTSQAKFAQASHAKILPKFELKNIWGPSPRARGALDPSGGFVISQDTSTSIPGDLRYFTQVDMDLIQPIFTFGKLSGLSDAAYHGVQAGEANLAREKAKVKFEVRQLYWAVVLGKELLAAVEEADKELKKAENKIEEKLDEGSEDVSQIDLFKIQIFRYNINKKLREAADKIDLARTALRTALGMEEDVEIEVATEYLEPLEVKLDSLPTYYEMAYQRRAELSQLQAGISARKALVRVSKSEYFPQFFLGGQIKWNFAKDRFDPTNPFIYNPTNYFRPGIIAGLNLNLNFLQTRDKVRVAQAEYRQLAQKEELLLDGIRLEIKNSYLDLTRAEKDMRDSRKALKSSENWLRSATMTFDIGVGEVKDLIDAFKAKAAMQAAHLENIFRYNVAAAQLSKAVGLDLYPK